MLEGRVIIVGVTGSIAAYKAAELTRLLVRGGAGVRVVMTDAATRFITPLTMQTLSRHPVAVDMFAPPGRWEVEHIELAQAADLMVVAPASANAIARLAHGLADDMLTTVALAACGRGRPLFIAPAMNRSMLDNPLTQDNIDRLRRFGARIIASASGELACGEYGDGRMAEPESIAAVISQRAATPWTGRTVLVSAGPTREHIDTVRFLSNPSSGKMGFALARALRDAGAAVTVVAGPVTASVPAGVELIEVTSADDMAAALRGRARVADAVFMAAAVADVTPVERRDGKASKAELFAGGTVRVRPTIDILRALADDRGSERHPVLVGFAAYAGDWDSVGRKLDRKGADMIVANDITEPGSGFDSDTNRVTLLFSDGRQEPLPPQSKIDAARIIIERAAALL